MGEPGAGWRLGRRPALDGLRGVAVVLVVLNHSDVPGFDNAGQVGVTVFFVLSGFLIATLLFEEREASGRLRLAMFYRRRVLRLAPALVAVVAVTSLFTMATGVPWVTSREVVGALFYCSNILSFLLGPGGGGAHMLHHTWSLVVEEQFYLLWPAVMVLASRRRALLMAFLLAGAGGSLALRLALWNDGAGINRVLFGTGTRVDGILIGCALAVSLRGRAIAGPRPTGRAAVVVGLVSIATLGVWQSELLLTWGVTMAAAASALVIFGILVGRGDGVLTLGPLVWLGKRSYGLYLWHHPITIFLGGVTLAWGAKAAIVIPLSLLLTVLSWRCIEQPFLALRDKPSQQPRGVSVPSDDRVAQVTGPSAVAIAVSGRPILDPWPPTRC